jgi:hypothetical protein
MITESVSPAVIQGYAAGALIMTFFGSFWGSMSMFGLDAGYRIWLILVVLLVTIPLAYSSIMLIREAHHLPYTSTPAGEARGATMRKWFGIIAGIEFATIAIASFLLGRAGRDELIPLVIALIVGLHFLPLANVFEVPAYYVTGIAMSVLALVALVAIFLGWTLGAAYAWAAIVGVGSALILWTTAFYVLMAGRHFLNAASALFE